MGKDMSEKKIKKEKKDKKDKKEKRAEVDGVVKPKKEKKDKKVKADADLAEALEAELEKDPEVSLVNVVDGAGDANMGEDEVVSGALVPFAFPLAEDQKEVKKILRTVKKCESSSPPLFL